MTKTLDATLCVLVLSTLQNRGMRLSITQMNMPEPAEAQDDAFCVLQLYFRSYYCLA